MRPVIGIFVDPRENSDPRSGGMRYQLNANYVRMVADAGGNPVLITPETEPEELASLVDGILIPGGLDIDAAEYGAENHEKNELQVPLRYQMERRVYAALPRETPVFGICYGAQFLNVAEGGTLVQHLPETVGHESHSGGTLQRYELAADSKLAAAVGGTVIEGKSYHHQAVGEVAPTLRITAQAEDGTIEAVESTERSWAVGVQWHPERTPDDPATRRLFQAFIQAAAAYRLVRSEGAK